MREGKAVCCDTNEKDDNTHDQKGQDSSQRNTSNFGEATNVEYELNVQIGECPSHGRPPLPQDCFPDNTTDSWYLETTSATETPFSRIVIAQGYDRRFILPSGHICGIDPPVTNLLKMFTPLVC